MNEYKVVSLFPEIYDIKPFINKDYPVLHPDSSAYSDYWEKEEIRCIQGFWGKDSKGELGGFRFMPAPLYFYINYCVIYDEDEKGKTTGVINPSLRDVEWIVHYGYLVAQGFSGFRDDPTYTSNLIIKKIHQGLELSPKEEILLDKLEYVKKANGEYKEYVEAKEYLYRTFKKPLGIPVYDNEAKNFLLLSSRGIGKSMIISGIINHTYTFFGKKFYDDTYLIDPAGAEIVVGAAQTSKSSELLKKFNQMQEFLKTGPGSWGKGDEFISGYFYNNSMGSLKANNADSPYRHEYKAKEGGVWIDKGTKTKITHVAWGDNAEAAAGTRPQLMVLEECGLADSLLKIHASSAPCMVRKNKFGVFFMLGTSGNMDKITDSKIIFEDPESYDFVTYPDLWENRIKPTALFIPAYYRDNSFKDPNGNTKIVQAYAQELLNRKQKEQSTNSMALDGHMMNFPLVPSEMFLSATANTFPTAKLRAREAEIETKNLFNTYASIGDLEWDSVDKKTVKWVEDLSSKRHQRPILTLNLDQYKIGLNSAIVIYEHPPDNIPNPTYRKSLYKVVYDPVKDDNGGSSLASILVYKGFADVGWNSGLQNTIVAEYIGRYDKVDDIHDIALKIAHYFNALILVENNIPGFINYCKMNQYVHKLQLSPYEAISKSGMQTFTRKYDYGVTMTKSLSLHCEQLGRQWLLETWKKDSNDNLLLTLDTLYSLRLIRELIAYDRDGNYDHVSALKLLMLWLSQERDVEIKEYSKKDDPYVDLNKFYKQVRFNSPSNKNPWYN